MISNHTGPKLTQVHTIGMWWAKLPFFPQSWALALVAKNVPVKIFIRKQHKGSVKNTTDLLQFDLISPQQQELGKSPSLCGWCKTLGYSRWFEHFLLALSLHILRGTCGKHQRIIGLFLWKRQFLLKESGTKFRLWLSNWERNLADFNHSFNQATGKYLLSTCNVQGDKVNAGVSMLKRIVSLSL